MLRSFTGLVLAVALATLPASVAKAQEVPQDELLAEVEQALKPVASDRLFRVAKAGLSVVDLETGVEVYNRKAEKKLVPASTMKVLTAAAALKALGPAYRFSTDVYTDGELDGAGVLHGNLYVKGHGDPTLVVERLWKLMADLKVEGIQRVEGNVVFDASFFDSKHQLVGWNKARDIERGPSYFSTLSALSLNFNTASIVVGPGAEVGGPARVFSETPAGGYIVIENEVVTGAAEQRPWVTIERTVTEANTSFLVRGSVPSDGQVKRYYRTVANPTLHFIAAWRELEKQHGIKVRGKHKLGATPAKAELLLHYRSQPLTTVLMDMNKYSNNFMAETVLKTIGAEMYGAPGTTQNGLLYVAKYLKSIGVPDSAYHLVNGSGLSRSAKLAPQVLTAVLNDMAHDLRVGSEFATSLAIAGADGTLRRRLAEDPGRVRGKTGTIDGVHGLTGYVEGADGRRYAFAFLVNGLRGGSSPAKKLHDRFLRRMFNVGSVAADTASNSTPPSR